MRDSLALAFNNLPGWAIIHHRVPSLRSRLIRLPVVAIAAAVVVTGLLACLAEDPSGAVTASYSPGSEFVGQKAANGDAHMNREWPAHSPADQRPTPQAFVAEGGSQPSLCWDNGKPGFSASAKLGWGDQRLSGRQHLPGASSPVPPHRSLQVLLCRWVL